MPILLIFGAALLVWFLGKNNVEEIAPPVVAADPSLDQEKTEPKYEAIDPNEIPHETAPHPGHLWQSRFFNNFRAPDLTNWKRPAGPIRVALQVGHWKTNELPDELERLRERGGGTSGGGKAEWEVNLTVANAAKNILEAKGIVVDILPATIPPAYWADAFVAIHADGNTSANVSGFKIASPFRDFTGKAQTLVETLSTEYKKATGFSNDANVTHSMRGYYAFNWWRYKYALNPMTTAAIIEMGFLTNQKERELLIRTPEKAAQGIANGIVKFLNL